MISKPIGSLRQRVTWETFSTAGELSYNQQLATPVTQGTFWAAIQPLTAQELILAQAQGSLVTHQVVMRWIGQIKAKDRLLYSRNLPDGTSQTVTLEIASVIDVDERHFELQLLCKELQ